MINDLNRKDAEVWSHKRQAKRGRKAREINGVWRNIQRKKMTQGEKKK